MNNRSSFSGKLGFVLAAAGVFHIWRRSTEAAHSFWFI